MAPNAGPDGRARDREQPHPHRAARRRPITRYGSSGPGPDDVDHRAGDDRRRASARGRPWPSIPGPGSSGAARPGARSSTRARSRPTTPRSSAACPDPTGTPVLLRLAGPAAHAPSSGPRRRTGCWSWTAAIAACPSPRPSRPGLRRPRRRRPPRRRPAGRSTAPPTSGTAPPRRHRRRHHRPPRGSSTTTATTAAADRGRTVSGDHGDRRDGTDARRRPRPRPDQGAQRRQGRRRPRPRRRPPRRRRPRPSRSPSGRPTRARAGRPSSGRRTARRPTWAVLVRQPGLADRQLVVVQALS